MDALRVCSGRNRRPSLSISSGIPMIQSQVNGFEQYAHKSSEDDCRKYCHGIHPNACPAFGAEVSIFWADDVRLDQEVRSAKLYLLLKNLAL